MADALIVQRSVLETIPGLKQLVLLVAIALAIAAGIWLVFWSQGPSYSVLFGNLEGREAGQVMDQLNAAGIPFKLDDKSGAILVPEDKVRSARVQLASQGLPQSSGMESMDGQSAFGTSQFMESARYQHALETELARTVSQVQGVSSARVHLAIPKQSVFVRDRKKPGASVMLQLYGGRHLEPGQVAAIVHVVASSVPELEASEVTVVDQNGTLLSSPEDEEQFALSAKQLEYQNEIERSYSSRIEDMLTPIVGAGRVRARVTADVDFTMTESTSENYNPQTTSLRSEQTALDQRLPGETAQGIPGALSNQPPNTTGAPPAAQQQPAPAAPAAGAVADANAKAAAPAATTPVATSQRATRNWEVDRAITHTRAPVGMLKKLSVAVILDDLQKTDASGTTTTTPLTQADIDRFTNLVKQAIGFDEQRGDKVNVMNASFKVDAPSAGDEESIPFYSQPWIKEVGKQIVGVVLVLLLGFLIVRPVMRSLTTVSVRSTAGAGGAIGDIAGDRVTIGGAGGGGSIEQQVAAARSLVGQDPKRAAAVVKDWVAADS
ncbi:MAG: flagellar basal-body MS-ring/collar protein FliF [Steroidobacterales bacterium]